MDATVYIVDDESDVLNSLGWLIESVGYKANLFSAGEALLKSLKYVTTPCCLVLDVRMPGMSGLEIQETLKNKKFNIPVIFITGHGDIPMAVRAMKNGALEFFTKPINNNMLLESINKALKIDKKNKEKNEKNTLYQSRINSLTQRELEVFKLMAAGAQTKLIAEKLNISPNTAELHRSKVMKKMSVNTLAELVKISIQHHLVEMN